MDNEAHDLLDDADASSFFRRVIDALRPALSEWAKRLSTKGGILGK
jgi:hypothetical protein